MGSCVNKNGKEIVKNRKLKIPKIKNTTRVRTTEEENSEEVIFFEGFVSIGSHDNEN